MAFRCVPCCKRFQIYSSLLPFSLLHQVVCLFLHFLFIIVILYCNSIILNLTFNKSCIMHQTTAHLFSQGAIIGPILLCCLIVVFNVYQRMLANESVSARTAAVDADSSQNSSQLQRAFVLDRNVPPNIPALYLHRSTPTDASTSSPANIGGVTSAASLLSPATPNSVFRPGGRSALRKAAVVGSRRLHRSNSLPNVDDA